MDFRSVVHTLAIQEDHRSGGAWEESVLLPDTGETLATGNGRGHVFGPVQTRDFQSLHPKETPMAKIGRSAITGRFVPVRQAEKRPSTHVVETVKRPANGGKK